MDKDTELKLKQIIENDGEIKAINIYRDMTGMSLADSNTAIKTLIHKMNTTIKTIGVYCICCGYTKTYGNKAYKSISDVRKLVPKICPNCKNLFYKNNEGLYYEGVSIEDVTSEDVFNYMKSVREKELMKIEEASKKEATNYLNGILENSKADNTPIIIKVNTNFQIKDYLKYIIQAHSLLFYLQIQLQKLIKNLIINENKCSLQSDIFMLTLEPDLMFEHDFLIGKKERIQKKLENQDKLKVKITNEEVKKAGLVKPVPPKKIKMVSISKINKPIEPKYSIPNIFNKKRILAYNETLKNIYEKELKAYEKYLEAVALYEKQLAEYDKKKKIYDEAMIHYKKMYDKLVDKERIALVEKLKNELEDLNIEIENTFTSTHEYKIKKQNEFILSNPLNNVCVILNEEIEKVKERIINTAKSLNKLYSCDLIYPKYRDYVAICSFYEYFDSGRCETLDGPFGAYNMYESDLKANLLIEQIGKIVNSLDDIKNNQNVIYTELKTITNQVYVLQDKLSTAIAELKSISTTTKAIAKTTEEINVSSAVIADNTNIIKENTALTAYYSAENAYWSKKNAELTGALGLFMALNG